MPAAARGAHMLALPPVTLRPSTTLKPPPGGTLKVKTCGSAGPTASMDTEQASPSRPAAGQRCAGQVQNALRNQHSIASRTNYGTATCYAQRCCRWCCFATWHVLTSSQLRTGGEARVTCLGCHTTATALHHLLHHGHAAANCWLRAAACPDQTAHGLCLHVGMHRDAPIGSS
jgi:hypothetical protein